MFFLIYCYCRKYMILLLLLFTIIIFILLFFKLFISLTGQILFYSMFYCAAGVTHRVKPPAQVLPC